MPYFFRKYYPARNILFVIGEATLIYLAISLVLVLFNGTAEYFSDLVLNNLRAALVTAIFLTCLYYFDLYDFNSITTFGDTATRITQAFGVGCIVLGIIYFFYPAGIISTKIFWTGYLTICAGIAVWRFFYALVLDKKLFAVPVLLVGGGGLAGKIAGEIISRRDAGFRIAAWVSPENPAAPPPALAPVFVESYDSLLNVVRRTNAERIVVALDDRRGKMPATELITCKLAGIPIINGIEFFEELTGKIIVERVTPGWIIFSRGFNQSRLTVLIKRISDILLAAGGLVLFLPLSAVVTALIKLESPGPVLYRQRRTGQEGKIFKIIKFRSMRCDAEQENGAQWASENDCRVTRVGGFIRKHRLDEIPQMWNVLKGEMSFVGPRPERPVFVERLARTIPYYSLRHNVKPGITGWAQVCFQYGDTESAALRKLEYDLYYIKNMSFWLDILIVFRTVKIVLFRKGAR